MYYLLWLVVGVILVLPLLWYTNNLSLRDTHKFWGITLILAAIIYVGFGVVWGNTTWIVIEIIGIPVYGFFYYLSNKFSLAWLSLGWLLHPVWDVVLHLNGPGSHVAPSWYAIGCLSFDVTVSIYILYRLKQKNTKCITKRSS